MATQSVPPVTPESIKAAKAAMLRERFNVMRETGVVIRPDGTMVLPSLDVTPKAHMPKRWHCCECDLWFMNRADCPACGLALQRAH
jgi:hypothetical protein